MLQLNARHCDAFVHVMDGGSFEAAALKLHLTPSAVSQRVRALESELGHPLVVRTRPCRPTPAGRRLLQHLRQSRVLETELQADLAGEAAAPLVLALAVNADSLATWLVPVLVPLCLQHRLMLDLQVDDQAHTHRWMESGQVLAAVSDQAQAMRGCVAHPLGIMRYRLVASPAFIQQWFPKGLTRAAARRAPAVLYNRKDALHTSFLQTHLGLPADAYPCHFMPAVESFIAAVRMGLGYGMVPELQMLDDLAQGHLQDLYPAQAKDVALYWHQWKVQSPRLAQVSLAAVAAARDQLARQVSPCPTARRQLP